MRFLHTADWHLGRTLGGHALLEDQAHLLLGQFLDIVRAERPNAVLLAGDVFDRLVPDPGAVALLDDVFDAVIRDARVPMVVIPGNHDDARRLSFGARLLRGADLHIAPRARGCTVTLEDRHGPVAVVAAAYATPHGLAREAEDGTAFADHDAGFAWLAPHLHAQCDGCPRRVLVAHAFVAGGTTCESERALAVGGSGQVGARHLDGFHYVALGHLHRPQAVGAGGRVRYSGSPLAYSAGEAGQEKSVTLVEVDAAGNVAVEAIPLRPRRPLRVVEDSFDALLAAPVAGREDYVAITLTDPRPVPDAQRRLGAIYPHIVSFRNGGAPGAAGGPADAGAAEATTDPLALFEAFHRAMRGEPLVDEARPVVAAAIAAAAAEGV